jgi:HK97 family phage portal protein
VWIQRGFDKDGQIRAKALYPLNPEYTTILIDNRGILGTKDSVYIRYVEPKSGEISVFSYEDVLHYRSSLISSDGISGMATRDILAATIREKKEAQKLTRGVYKNGITGKAVLEYIGDLNGDAEKKLLKQLSNYTKGEQNYGSIIPIPLGMKLTPLNISLADVQFLDIKKYSSLEIASAFGIKPNQLNNYEKSSYSNSEAQNLSFYVDTLLYILNAYEQEDSYKLLSSYERADGYYLKRNVNAILRGDIKSQTDSLMKKVGGGVMQINEARRQLDLPDTEGGDKCVINGSYIDIKNVGEQYGIGKEGNEGD